MISYNGRELVFGQFPNGEVNLKHLKIDERDLNHVVTLHYENDADLFHLLLVRHALNNLQKPLILRITYVPYSRMDRDNGVYAFTLQALAYYINWMDWDEVIIYEPHSDVLPALLERVTVVSVTGSKRMQSEIDYVIDVWEGIDYQVFFPDAGAQKRYAENFKGSLHLVGFKTRDFETGKILESSVIGERTSDNVVIVDDLCSKGGTFILAAQKLREMGFKKIILVVAHCENTVFHGELFSSGLIDHMITTDSIPRVNATDQMTVVPLSEFRWN